MDKEKALLAWQAITAILALKKETNVADVDRHLINTPKPHVIAVQFILLGSGYATAELDVDGDYGKQSCDSLMALDTAAHQADSTE